MSKKTQGTNIQNCTFKIVAIEHNEKTIDSISKIADALQQQAIANQGLSLAMLALAKAVAPPEVNAQAPMVQIGK